MVENWKFQEPANLAVFASKEIAFHVDWICYVCHHATDGAWEFHPQRGISQPSEIAVVALKTIIEMDPSVAELWDLPLGWCAWRTDKLTPWQRMKM